MSYSKGLQNARGFLAGCENILLYIAVFCILVLGAIILASVVLRELGYSGVSDEVVIVGELMIGALVLPLAYVAADRGFIAVEVFTNRFGPRVQVALNILSAVVGICAVAPIAYAAYISMVDALESGSYFFGLLELPKWPGRIAFFIGYGIFFIRLIDLAIFETLVLCGVIRPASAEQAEE
ncbi:TRAP transporter small permease [Marinobacter litoralis]|nr:TRAP transporter small permease [Marinobacter litoralis]